MPSGPPDRYDGALGFVLFASTVAYLRSLPQPLGWADEAYFLYEAKRVAEGEVMYRDIFEFVTPGAVYIMALLFRVFGATMTVASTSMAVLHGLAVTLLFASCRQLGVRRAVAALSAPAYLTLAHAAWPSASWHWFSTAVLLLQCWALLRISWPPSPRAGIVLGMISGLAITIQQQRGMPLAAMVGALVVFDHVVARRFGAGEPMQALICRLVRYTTGMLLVTVPVLAPSLLLAGLETLVDSWIRFPMESYRPTFSSPWGWIGPLTGAVAQQTFPAVLGRLPPIALALSALRLLVGLMSGRAERETWRLAALLFLGTAAVLSIWYNPDFIHLAFVAPVFFIPVAEATEWVCRRAGGQHAAVRLSVMTATLGLATVFTWRLGTNVVRAWEIYPIAHETAFGLVDFSKPWEPVLIDALREQLRTSGSLEMFCYPTLAAPYLTAGGRNPTRFQFADSKVLPRRYTSEIVRVLWKRHVPTLVVNWAFLPDDPVHDLIRMRYTAVPIPGSGGLSPFFLYRERPGPWPQTMPEPPLRTF